MRRNTLIAAVAATLVSAAAWAAPGMGFGMGMGGGMGQGYGQGPGAGSGYCADQGLNALNLTSDQREKIAAIQSDLSNRQFALMGSMHKLRTNAFRNGQAPDSGAYAAMGDLRQQMFDLHVEGRTRIEAVLTPDQRSQWRASGWRGHMGG